jgi:hypothetical protein
LNRIKGNYGLGCDRDINEDAGREISQGQDLYMHSVVAKFQLAAIEKHARMGYLC